MVFATLTLHKVLLRGLGVAAAFLILGFASWKTTGQSGPVAAPPGAEVLHYLDCSSPQDGSGTEARPWNSPARVNDFKFVAGDHLLIRRGTRCQGALAPQGSGLPGTPIVIDTYGTGAAPIIDGGEAEAALKLFNQQYWEISNLEIVGGHRYGVHVSGNLPDSNLNHIYLRNLDVHGATYTSKKRGDSGEVVVSTEGTRQILNDVLIDGVIAHDTHASEGIDVSAGGKWIEGNGVLQPLGNNVTVQNSTAHDVYGDGIVISELNNGLLQSNTVYRSGLCPDCTDSTPVGIWEWYCHTCTVQFNESYANQSWGGDGGGFDIDYYNTDNLVQYNYAHDSQGYCIAIFGAGGRATVNSVFRYNICANNGRRPDLAKQQGEIFLYTWDEGSLDGAQVYNNTIYWNPAGPGAAITVKAAFSGTRPRFIKNNIVYATVPEMVQAPSGIAFDNNLYFTSADSAPTWQFGGATYTGFKAYQSATAQDAHSYYANPLLSSPQYHAAGRPQSAFRLLPGSPARKAGVDVCRGIAGCSMGTGDFWGKRAPAGAVHNIGADEGD